MSEATGMLCVIATPIGNLGDITPRAVQALKDSNPICAEDTRRTRALLAHLAIHGKRVVALHAHSSPRAVAQAVEWVSAGCCVGLVTDAGTPCVSDPGSELIRACHRQGLRVMSLPGPSALTAAASASGLVNGAFCFLGFAPRRGTKRHEFLQRICESRDPCVLFEAPGRLRATLQELAHQIPEREACVAREVSKLHEEIVVDTLGRLAERDPHWRGECTIVVSGRMELPVRAAADDATVREEIATALRAGASTKALAQALAERLGQPRKEIYSLILAVQRQEALGPGQGRC